MRYRYQVRDEVHEVSIERSGESLRATVDGQPFEVDVLDEQEGQISLRMDGRPVTVHWAADGGGKWVSLGGCAYRLEKPAGRRAKITSVEGGASVRAPMPAQVREVQVEEGELVEKGQTLLLLEAMKMEIRVKAPVSGRVRRLAVSAGQTVDKDQALAEISPEAEPGEAREGG